MRGQSTTKRPRQANNYNTYPPTPPLNPPPIRPRFPPSVLVRNQPTLQAMTAFRGGGGSGGGARGGAAGMSAAGEAEKRRRTAAMGKSGLQGYLTSAQDALLRGFWQVRDRLVGQAGARWECT